MKTHYLLRKKIKMMSSMITPSENTGTKDTNETIEIINNRKRES